MMVWNLSEVRIRIDFEEIGASYNNLTDLENGLKDIDKAIEIVNSKLASIKSKEKLKVITRWTK